MIKAIQYRRESTAEWLEPGQRAPGDEDGVRLIGAGPTGVVEAFYSEIGQPWNNARLANFAALLQERSDVRQPLQDFIDADDPRGTEDPETECMFWDGDDMVSRTVFIEDPEYDEGLLKFTVRRAKVR